MGKGMEPKKGYNQKKYAKGYDQIKWKTNEPRPVRNNKDAK